MQENTVQDIEILAKGSFSPEDIRVSVSESNRKIDPFVESKLEEVWQKKLKEAAEKGKNIYNGLSYRLNSLSENEGKLNIDFGIFDYKTRDGLIFIPEYFNLGREYYRMGCYVSSTIKTSDNKYLLVELSGKSMNTNRYEFIGGIMETKIPIKNGESIFSHLHDEMSEEASILNADISSMSLKSVSITDTHNVDFYFEVVLKTDSTTLQNRFKDNRDQDIKNLLVLDKIEYLDILKTHKSKVKNFVATIVEI